MGEPISDMKHLKCNSRQQTMKFTLASNPQCYARQLTSAMMCDPPERLQFGFQKAEVPATTNTVDRQCSLVHPETHFVNPLLASHADGVKSYRRRCQSQRGRPTPDALGSRGSLCGHVMSLGMCGLGRQRSGPSSQRFPLVPARNP